MSYDKACILSLPVMAPRGVCVCVFVARCGEWMSERACVRACVRACGAALMGFRCRDAGLAAAARRRELSDAASVRDAGRAH
eukprot:COSAG01_NODE_22509_length_852_cov_1.716088_1_plen_81_part_10